MARADALIATFPGFLAVNRLDANGVISFVYPPDANRLALGRNVTEKPLAAKEFAIALARDETRLTPPLALYQGGTGIAVYVRTHAAGEPTTLIQGVFRTDTLIPACLGAGGLHDHSLAIHDADLQVFERPENTANEPFAATTQVPVFNRTWTLRMAPAEVLIGTALRPGRLILVAGLPLSLAAAILLFAGLAVRDRARVLERRAQQEHQQLLAALQQAQRMESLGRLAGGVAHDFNNLLTVILSSTHLLTVGTDRAHQAENIEAIEDAAQRAATMTRELLVFGRGDAAALGPIDLAATVSSLRSLLSRLIRGVAELDIRVPAAPVIVTGSAVQIEQIVVNLVMNAVAAMPDGGPITVEVTTADGKATLAVADRGAGIPPEIIDRIFEPFFTTKDGAGTGLGLATVYGHVQRMNGTITVGSTPGSGTVFTATFPLISPSTAAA